MDSGKSEKPLASKDGPPGSKPEKISLKPGEFDVFYLDKVYPDVSSVFSMELSSLEKIKGDCLVVLDTNVLLAPYRTSAAALQQIRKTYQDLIKAKRLYLPAQAAREFSKHRLGKIHEMYQTLKQREGRISNVAFPITSDFPILASLPDYEKLQKLNGKLRELITEYEKSYKKLIETISGWTLNDDVSNLYRKIFNLENIVAPTIEESDIKADLGRRTVHKIAPGFQDSQKEDGGIGDLLIWHTILELAKRKQHMLFITNEEKTDWWCGRDKGQAPLYPRFELIDEYWRASQGKSFHMASLDVFLNLFGASPEIVAEVVEARHAESLNRPKPDSELIRAAIMWLKARFNANQVTWYLGSARTGYDVKIETPKRLIEARIKCLEDSDPIRVVRDARFWIDSEPGSIDKIQILIFDTPSRVSRFLRTFKPSIFKNFVIGVVIDGGFVPLKSYLSQPS